MIEFVLLAVIFPVLVAIAAKLFLPKPKKTGTIDTRLAGTYTQYGFIPKHSDYTGKGNRLMRY
jgi:hypothetical protein